MKSFLFICMVVAALAVLASLTIGIVVMGRGGEANLKYGNKLMRLRVFLQGLALAFFALGIVVSQNTN